jgi:geranylgeranyl diphosphate synthase type II
MIGGQVLDMEGENQALTLEPLQRLHRMKTGALLVAACRMGGIAAGEGDSPKLHALTSFGRHIGLAFQIVDDLLDVTASPEQLGKKTGKDAGKGKNTYPRLLGLAESRREADRQLDEATKALDELGPAAGGLRALARFVVERDR